MKWYSQSQYVDQQTGEIITKNEALNNYRIIKKIKNHERKKIWRKLQNGQSVREDYGLTTITNICTKEGIQQRLW